MRDLSAFGFRLSAIACRSVVGFRLIGPPFCNRQHDLRRNMTKITPSFVELPCPRRRLSAPSSLHQMMKLTALFACGLGLCPSSTTTNVASAFVAPNGVSVRLTNQRASACLTPFSRQHDPVRNHRSIMTRQHSSAVVLCNHPYEAHSSSRQVAVGHESAPLLVTCDAVFLLMSNLAFDVVESAS